MGLKEGEPIRTPTGAIITFDTDTDVLRYNDLEATANQTALDCMSGGVPACDRCTFKEFPRCPGVLGTPVHGDATDSVQPNNTQSQVIFEQPTRPSGKGLRNRWRVGD